MRIHGAVWGYDSGCRCDECTAAHTQARTAVQKQQNDESLATAHKHGEAWTGPEMEFALREDLTVREIATRLGRSVQGVRMIRHKCRHEPKYIAMVGMPDDTEAAS